MADDFRESPEWLAFIRAALDEPGCDKPMLVAADWLEERGDSEVAKLIRIQMDNSNRFVTIGDVSLPHGRWTWGVKKSRMNNWMKWKRPAFRLSYPILNDHPYRFGVTVVIRRGAIRRIVCRPHFWLYAAQEVIRRCPLDSVSFQWFIPGGLSRFTSKFTVSRGTGHGRSDSVPVQVFDSMPCWSEPPEVDAAGVIYRAYSTPAVAQAAVSEGAIRWALDLPPRIDKGFASEIANDGFDGTGSLGYFFRDSLPFGARSASENFSGNLSPESGIPVDSV